MNNKRPLIITFIGDITVLAGLLSIASLFPVFQRHFGFSVMQIPIFSYSIVQALLGIILLIASYGIYRLKKWAYWLIIAYNAFFLLVYIIFCLQNKYLYISINAIITFIDTIFILPTKKYFYEEDLLQRNL